MSSPGVKPADSIAATSSFTASSFDGRFGREPTFVAERGREAAVVQHALQRVVRLGSHAQRFAERRGADGREHELLEVDVRVGVRATVEHVHARQRQRVRVRAADVAVEREVALVGAGLRRGERDAEQRVRAEARLVVRAVELDQRLVEEALVEAFDPDDRLADLAVDVRDRALDALAAVAVAAVAQLDRLVGAGARPARDGRAAPGPGEELDLDLDGRVAAASPGSRVP